MKINRGKLQTTVLFSSLDQGVVFTSETTSEVHIKMKGSEMADSVACNAISLETGQPSCWPPDGKVYPKKDAVLFVSGHRCAEKVVG